MGAYGRKGMLADVLLHGVPDTVRRTGTQGVGEVLEGVILHSSAQGERVPAGGVGGQLRLRPAVGEDRAEASSGEDQGELCRRVGLQLVGELSVLDDNGVDAAVRRVGEDNQRLSLRDALERPLQGERAAVVPAGSQRQQECQDYAGSSHHSVSFSGQR